MTIDVNMYRTAHMLPLKVCGQECRSFTPEYLCSVILLVQIQTFRSWGDSENKVLLTLGSPLSFSLPVRHDHVIRPCANAPVRGKEWGHPLQYLSPYCQHRATIPRVSTKMMSYIQFHDRRCTYKSILQPSSSRRDFFIYTTY